MGKLVVGVSVLCTAAVVCRVAVLLMKRGMKNSGEWGKVEALLKDFEEKCATPVGKLRQVADAMTVEMHAGLASEGGSKLKMLISYVDSLPTGDVEGLFYALDLGGTNFRVMRVQLGEKEKRMVKHEVKEVLISQNVMAGSSSEVLFDFIATALAEFVATEGDDSLQITVYDSIYKSFWALKLPEDRERGKSGGCYLGSSAGGLYFALNIRFEATIIVWYLVSNIRSRDAVWVKKYVGNVGSTVLQCRKDFGLEGYHRIVLKTMVIHPTVPHIFYLGFLRKVISYDFEMDVAQLVYNFSGTSPTERYKFFPYEWYQWPRRLL